MSSNGNMKGFHYVVIATVNHEVGGEVSVTPGNTQQVRCEAEDRKPLTFSRSVRLGEEVLSNNCPSGTTQSQPTVQPQQQEQPARSCNKLNITETKQNVLVKKLVCASE